MKKKYVKPQVECYVINNPCLLLTSPDREQDNTSNALDFYGDLG